ncbi:protein DpdH [Leptothrix sp. BB-4]
MTSLSDFWPSPQNIAECIRTEAEVVDDAVLLAVHEPGPLITRTANGAVERPATEANLLASLMRDASDGSAVLVAITGESGVGKSHLVRWLYAQLQRHPRRDQLVIVLVPKTASLRQVVERILQPLQGEAYSKLLAELSQTVDHLRPSDAAEMLCTAISLVLKQRFDEGMASLQATDREDRKLRERLDLTRVLRDLIREPEVFDQWFRTPLERIVRQTIEGGSEQQTGEQRRFVPADLDPPESYIPDGIRRTVQAALQKLTRNDGASRPLAAEILQEALDPALRDVFQFSRALGQRTIEEIVDGIRQQLLKEGKELVLLIEDFAALAGIQQPLLNLMIAESDHGGVRVRAPIRTALAVTDGFLPSRQTILTRAKQEWLIPNTAATPQAIIDRMVSLAGRYLNAARWGAEALRKQFEVNPAGEIEGWVKPFPTELSDDDLHRLSAFGASPQGYPLFPLSDLAIESIARRELSPGGELRLNPRAFIDTVLRQTLSHRSLYESRAFPPANFKGAAPNATVQIALKARGMPREQLERLAPVLDYWAGNPGNLSDAPRAAKGVFEAFDLPWPFDTPLGNVAGAASGVGQGSVKAPVAQPVSPQPPPPASTPAPELGYLNSWSLGSIDQKSALRVRKLLAEALKDRIEWSVYRLKARSIEIAHLWLPYASVGNPTNEPKFVVAAEARPLDPVLLAGLAALERWSENKKSWDYTNAEADYPIAQQLLDRIEAQAVAWHTTSAEQQAGVALKLLHRQALLLRLSHAVEPRTPPLSDYFAGLIQPPWEPDAADTQPAAMIARVIGRAEAARATVSTIVARSLGCFQGDGDTVQAIDLRRTKSAWRQPLPEAGTMLISTQLGDFKTAADEMFNASRVEGLLKRYSAATTHVLLAIRERLSDWEGAGPATQLLEQLQQAQKAGLFALIKSGNFEQSKRAVETLSAEEARQLIRQALAFKEPDPESSIETRLLAWSALNMRQLVAISDALALLDRVLPDLDRAADSQLSTLGGADIGAMLTGLQTDLESITKEVGQ